MLDIQLLLYPLWLELNDIATRRVQNEFLESINYLFDFSAVFGSSSSSSPEELLDVGG